MIKESNSSDDLLDITVVKNFSLFYLVINLPKLYNGKIVHHKKVTIYKTNHIEIIDDNKKQSFIEADGKILGNGSLKATIISKVIQFIILS